MVRCAKTLSKLHGKNAVTDSAEDLGIRVQNGKRRTWVHECTSKQYRGAWFIRDDNYCPYCETHWSEHEDTQMPEMLRRSEEW